MTVATIGLLFERDIDKLIGEINDYAREEQIWEKGGQIQNAPGHLVLHLCGNLQHFIGAGIGHNGYIRDRNGEFSQSYISRVELIQRLEEAKAMIKEIVLPLSEEDLYKKYPLEFMGRYPSHLELLLYLLTHFSYHLGQVNYHRRLIQ